MNTLSRLRFACVFVASSLAVWAVSAGSIRPVSQVQIPMHSGAGHSSVAAFSGDGQRIVFVSQANNLVTHDNLAPWLDVFVRDVAASNTVLVSVNTNGVGGGNADASSPAISSNGQFIAFASAAGNLVASDSNGAKDIFVRDLTAGETRLISVDVSGQAPSNSAAGSNLALSSNPLISADGRLVAFESLATNLVTLPDANGGNDIFVRDWQSGITRLASVNATGTGTGNGASESPSLSADAARVAFVSTAADLVSGGTPTLGDVYVRDLQSNVTLWASADVALILGHLPGGYRCFDPILSADGQCVAFKASVLGQSAVHAFHHDLRTATTQPVATNCQFDATLHISGDGQYVAYGTSYTFHTDPSQVYRWDALTQTNLLVSVRPDGTNGGNRSSRLPSMSTDGQTIAFTSWATDLIDGISNSVSQVFVRDLATDITRLVSAATNGLPSTQSHDLSATLLNPGGNQLAFDSQASDLVEGDSNQAEDVFLFDLDGSGIALVSSRHSERSPHTATGNATVRPGAVSADGRRVVFTSFDSSLVGDDTNFFRDAFVRDFETGKVLPVTIGVAGDPPTNAIGLAPSISRDGRCVTYAAVINFLAAPNSRKVFWRDLQSNVTQLVYARGSSSATLPAPPTLSADGAWVGFEADDPGLVSYVSVGSGIQVYVRSMEAGTNQLVSINPAGTSSGYGDSLAPVLSPDGRWVAFKSKATELTPDPPAGTFRFLTRDLVMQRTYALAGGDDFPSYVFSEDSRRVACVQSGSGSSNLLVFDLIGQPLVFATNNAAGPSLSADGRWLVFEAPSTGSVRQIYARDLQTGLTELVSVNSRGTGGGNGLSGQASISPDARFVVFASKASDLVSLDANGSQDVFIRDRVARRTILLSRSLNGTGSGNSASGNPVLSADGRTVVFDSFANNLVAGDYNDRSDVFVAEVGFSIIRLTRASSGPTTLFWSAKPGRTYRVQYKDRMEDAAWSEFPQVVTTETDTGAFTDQASSAFRQRYYQVVEVP